MEINCKLAKFLNDAHKLSQCNILLTDKSKFIFTSLCFKNDIFIGKNISKDLTNLTKFFIADSNFSYTSIPAENPCISLIGNECINYTAQIILPIFHEKLDGLLVFFSTDRNYLESNLRFARTTKYFTERLSINCNM